MSDDTRPGVPRDGARRSRRQLMAGAAGALGALTAQALVQAAPAQAAQGSPVIEGQDNTGATVRTSIFTVGNNEWATLADPNNSGRGSLGVYGHGQDIGVLGEAALDGSGLIGFGGGNGDGVQGFGAGNGTGVAGTGGSNGSAGVQGVGGGSNGAGVVGYGKGLGDGVFGAGFVNTAATGVAGTGGGSNGTGVQGSGAGAGDGVFGVSPAGNGVLGRSLGASGIGVLAENTGGGIALYANGPAWFTRSGVLTVGAGASKVTKTGVPLTGASLVLATLQQDVAGVWIRSAVPNVAGSSFTVHLNKAVTASITVAWFLVNQAQDRYGTAAAGRRAASSAVGVRPARLAHSRVRCAWSA